MMECMD
jgi:hypothetical protein